MAKPQLPDEKQLKFSRERIEKAWLILRKHALMGPLVHRARLKLIENGARIRNPTVREGAMDPQQPDNAARPARSSATPLCSATRTRSANGEAGCWVFEGGLPGDWNVGHGSACRARWAWIDAASASVARAIATLPT